MIKRVRSKLNREFAKIVSKKVSQFPASRKVVSFTFDDFPVSSIEYGAKVLEKVGGRGTFYAAFGMSGSGDIPPLQEMLSVAERGHELGCHTYSHLNCGEVSCADVKVDCEKNQEVARKYLRRSMKSFAYPFGEYRATTKKVIGEIYTTARTVEPGINKGRVDMNSLYAIPIDIRGGIDLVEKWVGKLEEDGGWAVFFTHEIVDRPSEFGSTQKLFSRAVDCCVEAGFEFMTVGEASLLCELSRGD